MKIQFRIFGLHEIYLRDNLTNECHTSIVEKESGEVFNTYEGAVDCVKSLLEKDFDKAYVIKKVFTDECLENENYLFT